MKQIKNTKLKLDNFREITGTFELNPGRNVFSGPNGSGKTTLFDASTFLLSGKDSQGSAKFGIKTIKGGVQVTETDHSVYGTYEIDGKPLELGRVYAEKYTGKRSAKKTKSGNETTYFVDKIEVKAKEYQEKISNAFGPHFSICSDIRFLAEMAWKERREILFPMAGAVDQEKVIDSVPELRELIGERTIEDAKKAADQRSKKIDSEIADIPGKIAEHQTIIDNAGGITFEMAEKAVVEAQTAIDETQTKIDNAGAGDKSADIETLRKLNDDLWKAEQVFNDEKSEAQKSWNVHLNDIGIIKIELENHQENLTEHNESIQALRDQYVVIRDKKPDDGHPCIHYGESCPYHGQSVPEEIRNQSSENFNAEKSTALEENQIKGGEMAAEIKRINATIAERQEEKTKLEKVEPDQILKMDGTKEIYDLQTSIENLKKATPAKEVPAELTQSLEAARIRLTQAQETRANIKSAESSYTRVEELTAKKGELSTENDRVQKFIFKYDEFNRAMAEAAEAPINAMFQNVNFRMFRTQEDGQIVDCCDVMDKKNRPYSGALSNGEKIQAGLDIVRTLQKHFKITAPVWIDNAESVTGDIMLGCQHIELRANNDHKQLTMEV